ncbi:MAG: alkaline phosphatase family protein [Melioribacteraceae bacterium]|nr:alkaline phosphatase family protein [Melioribacteraceae bacterium]
MKSIKIIFCAVILLFININAQKSTYTILVSFDGFRWDYVNRGITPTLQKVIKEGVHALSLRPTFPSKTFPNHLSIVTGLHASHHGIISNSIYDPVYKEKYKLSNKDAVTEARWYQGEAFWETAERQGIKTASYFWPGSEVTLDYRRPSYYKEYEHDKKYEERIDGVIDWLKLPIEERPRFITLYFDLTDTYGHDFGPNSEETNWAISRLDSMANYLIEKINETSIKDSVNVIFVSDHGMTEVSEDRIINVKNLIKDYECRISDIGPFMTIEPKKNDIDKIYNIIKKKENHFKIYKKGEIPDYYFFNDHHLVSSLLLVADIGWSLTTRDNLGKYTTKGNHGYEKDHTDMHGIFIAKGPGFKNNYKTGTLWNIDIYSLLCKIYNIYPRTNIDGRLERIGFILK